MSWDDNAAAYDQHHAAAIDALRGAKTFLLAVPAEEYEFEDGKLMKIAVIGGGEYFPPFQEAVIQGILEHGLADYEPPKKKEPLLTPRGVRYLLFFSVALNIAAAAMNVGLTIL